MNCKTCGSEMIQKSRARLVTVGLLMMASIAAPFFVRLLWAPCLIMFFTGIYLLVWAIAGHACWCRNCKKFNWF